MDIRNGEPDVINVLLQLFWVEIGVHLIFLFLQIDFDIFDWDDSWNFLFVNIIFNQTIVIDFTKFTGQIVFVEMTSLNEKSWQNEYSPTVVFLCQRIYFSLNFKLTYFSPRLDHSINFANLVISINYNGWWCDTNLRNFISTTFRTSKLLIFFFFLFFILPFYLFFFFLFHSVVLIFFFDVVLGIIGTTKQV